MRFSSFLNTLIYVAIVHMAKANNMFKNCERKK